MSSLLGPYPELVLRSLQDNLFSHSVFDCVVGLPCLRLRASLSAMCLLSFVGEKSLFHVLGKLIDALFFDVP